MKIVVSHSRTSPSGSLPRILVALSRGEADLVLIEFTRRAFAAETIRVDTPEHLRESLSGTWDLALFGAEFFGGSSGEIVEFLEKERDADRAVPLVLFTRAYDEVLERAVTTSGAADVIDGDRIGRLVGVLEREIARTRRHHEVAALARVEEERARGIEDGARQKSEFLANFSHEIRTPLNGILGYCDLLMRGEGTRLTPHGRRDLNVIKNNAKTLLSLHNDIFELSKIEAGRIEILRERVDIKALVDECAATVKPLIRSKDVELFTHVANDASHAFTDGLKVRQIILNLLSHAAKLTDAGEIHLSAILARDDLIIEVEDTGAGIPAGELSGVFEKVPRSDGVRRARGNGLGLVLVRELARVLGGTASVASTVGRGSTFTVVLPRAVAPEEPPLAQENPQDAEARDTPLEPAHLVNVVRGAMPPGGAILVVDDDAATRELVTRVLHAHGFQTVHACGGAEALARMKSHPPALVILDLAMPDVDGFTVLQRMQDEGSAIPVVVLTGKDLSEPEREQLSGAFAKIVRKGGLAMADLVSEAQRLVAEQIKEEKGPMLRILYVEDSAQNRDVVRRYLEPEYQVFEAEDGERGLERAANDAPDLVLMDLALPRIDGWEATRRIKADPALGHLPVVALTGRVAAEERERAQDAGCADYLTKPVERELLLATIRKHLRGRIGHG